MSRSQIASTSRLRPIDGASAADLRTIRAVTAGWCAALVLTAVAVNTLRMVSKGQPIFGFWFLLHEQVRIFGLMAVLLAVLTLPLGLSYGRGIAARRGVGPQVRAVHMTISISALATIVLHIMAILSRHIGSPSAIGKVLIPFAWSNDHGFPYPTPAGVIAFWIIVIFGLSYFLRERLGGARRWRVVHHVVIVGLLLSLLHSIYLSGFFVGGWG